MSGGNQIQNVVLQQSGGVPTNQLQSVTTSGVTKNYAYDAAGNVTNDGVHTYTDDSANRVVSVDGGSTAQYAYDQHNRRHKKTVGGVVTHYVWEGSQLIAENDGSTGAVIVDYVYCGTRMIAKVQGGATQYFLSDRLSTRVVVDASGNVTGRQAHLPFGEDFAESGSQEQHHFTSYDRDTESGTDYALNRQYSQGVGRFLRVDTSMGTIALPQSLNRYCYVTNNPVNAIDRLGLFPTFVNFPPVCPVVNGVAVCGSLGAISVNASMNGGTNGGGGGAGSDFDGILIENGHGPNAENETVGVGDPDILDLLKKFWDLNPCEKTVAMNTPFPFLEGILEAERIAQKVAKAFGDGDDDYGNAVKHCTWSCEMARRTNQYWAEQWGTAHECDKKGRKDRDPSALMDLHNNEVGRRLAKKPASEGSCAALCARSKDIKTSP